jgi:hypothetical protein
MLVKLTTLLLCVAALASCYAQNTTANESPDRAKLTRLEEVWNDAHLRADADALERLWADDLEVAVPRMPVMKKSNSLAFVRSGRMKFLRYVTSDVNIRIYGSTAVVTGRLQRKRVINGREVDDDWRFTKTYIHEVGDWRVVAFHASEAANP